MYCIRWWKSDMSMNWALQLSLAIHALVLVVFSLFGRTAVHALRICFHFDIYQPNGCDCCVHFSIIGIRHNVELVVMNVCNRNANGCDRVCCWTLYTPLVVTLYAMFWFCVWSGRKLRWVWLRGNTKNSEWMWTPLETTSVHFVPLCSF